MSSYVAYGSPLLCFENVCQSIKQMLLNYKHTVLKKRGACVDTLTSQVSTLLVT